MFSFLSDESAIKSCHYLHFLSWVIKVSSILVMYCALFSWVMKISCIVLSFIVDSGFSSCFLESISGFELQTSASYQHRLGPCTNLFLLLYFSFVHQIKCLKSDICCMLLHKYLFSYWNMSLCVIVRATWRVCVSCFSAWNDGIVIVYVDSWMHFVFISRHKCTTTVDKSLLTWSVDVTYLLPFTKWHGLAHADWPH